MGVIVISDKIHGELEKCHRTRTTSRTSKAAKVASKAVVVSRSPASKIRASKISSRAKSPVKAANRADSRSPAIKSATTTLPRRECRGIFMRGAPESRVDNEECFRWADEAETEEFKDTFIQIESVLAPAQVGKSDAQAAQP